MSFPKLWLETYKRQKIYWIQTAPILKYYKAKNLLKEVDGLGSIKHVNKRILNIQLLTENRAELFIFILIISAIVTPTGDPVSLFVFTIPLYVLMEITIFIHKKSSK